MWNLFVFRNQTDSYGTQIRLRSWIGVGYQQANITASIVSYEIDPSPFILGMNLAGLKFFSSGAAMSKMCLSQMGPVVFQALDNPKSV